MADRDPSVLAIFGRFTWMTSGPLTLALLVFPIMGNRDGWCSGTDLTYLAVLGLMLCCRWIDFRRRNLEAGTVQPIKQDIRRCLYVTGLLGLSIWVIANLLGNFWAGR